MFGEILPSGVHLFDQGYLLGTPPSFDLLFPSNGAGNLIIAFAENQANAVIFLGKPSTRPSLCCWTRCSIDPVTPIYSVPELLAIMSTQNW
jgi:hypothetical protein